MIIQYEITVPFKTRNLIGLKTLRGDLPSNCEDLVKLKHRFCRVRRPHKASDNSRTKSE